MAEDRLIQSGWCIACGYERRGTPIDTPCPECGAYGITTAYQWHRLGLTNQSTQKRIVAVAWFLLLANLGAAITFGGMGIRRLDLPIVPRFLNYFSPFDLPEQLFVYMVFGGIAVAGILSILDRWAFRNVALRIPLVIMAVSGLVVWGQVSCFHLGPGHTPYIAVTGWLFIGAALSGWAACFLMHRLNRVQRYRRGEGFKSRWRFWPWLVGVYVLLSMGWFTTYYLDWIVGLGLYLGFGNRAEIANWLFVVTGCSGLAVHSISLAWIYGILKTMRPKTQ